MKSPVLKNGWQYPEHGRKVRDTPDKNEGTQQRADPTGMENKIVLMLG